MAATILIVGCAFGSLQVWMHAPALIYIRAAAFSAAECESMVSLAEQANAWSRKRHKSFPTEDLAIHTVPSLANVTTAVESRVIPLLRSSYGLSQDEHISIKDLFLVRYSPAGQDELAMHSDGSTLSFSVALSAPDDFGGDGIEFDLMTAPIWAVQGSLLMHPSRLSHRGATVTKGTRYVLVGFVTVADDSLFLWNPWPAASATRHGLFSRCVSVVQLLDGETQTGDEHCRSMAGAKVERPAKELRNACALRRRVKAVSPFGNDNGSGSDVAAEEMHDAMGDAAHCGC